MNHIKNDKLVLLAEDNPDDISLTLRAFRKNNFPNDIVVVNDGAEAIDYLFGGGVYAPPVAPPLPRLVLFDLKLPKLSGLEVLKKVRSERRTRLLPVVVFTTSREDGDVAESYRLGANSYIRKPVDFAQFSAAIGSLGVYWCEMNVPPSMER